jgi:hypothetical protein
VSQYFCFSTPILNRNLCQLAPSAADEKLAAAAKANAAFQESLARSAAASHWTHRTYCYVAGALVTVGAGVAIWLWIADKKEKAKL